MSDNLSPVLVRETHRPVSLKQRVKEDAIRMDPARVVELKKESSEPAGEHRSWFHRQNGVGRDGVWVPMKRGCEALL